MALTTGTFIAVTVMLHASFGLHPGDCFFLAAEADPAPLAEGLLADYLLVLLQGLRGSFSTVDAQLAHFDDFGGAAVGRRDSAGLRG